MSQAGNTDDEAQPIRPLATVLGGLLGGIAAAGSTYGLLFVLKAGAVTGRIATTGSFVDLLGGARPGDWQVVGWLFFEAHNVGITSEITSTGPTMVGAVSLRNGPLWAPWFLLLPVVVLLGAGVLFALAVGASDPRSGFRSGSALALGYVGPVIAGLLACSWGVGTRQAGYYVAPDLIGGFLIAGVAYPIVMGGLGGAIAGRT